MTTFGTEFQLSSLDGTNGFQINGETSGDQAGFSLASAGDVNGDGFDDLIVGAISADGNVAGSGASYVVFGHAGGFASSIDLSTLNGANGFKISGEAVVDNAGVSVASAGDLNGDGFDDVIVGAHTSNANGNNSGTSYVVFGRAGGFAANLQVSALDGSNGFRINGEAADDILGFSVASAGDINGDGFSDLIVGANAADPNGSGSGASYVVFGRAGGLSPSFDLASLNGSNGFQINGEAAGDGAGFSVASAGDVNGDGFDDLLIGAPGVAGTGAAYVVFGHIGAFTANFNLSGLNGSNGFQISGELASDAAGRSVASAGDVNGDGFDDLIIGAEFADPHGGSSGASYVVFGRGGGFSANFDLASLDGANGFQISGEAANDQSGHSVASAGDINRDGFDDLIIGANFAGSFAGASYVVFGAAGGYAANLDLSSLDGSNGFQLDGEVAGDFAGSAVASAGDVNGDGFDDMVLGAAGTGANPGAAYVIFGKATHGTDGNDVLDASGIDDHLAGLGGDDILRGNGGADTLSGGDGTDQLFGGVGTDTLAGGAGDDFLDGGANGDQLFGGAGNDTYALGADADGADSVSDTAGIDTITSTINRALFFADYSEIENLTLLGTATIGIGNALANTVTGNAAANIIDGFGNLDTLVGGAGSDTYFVDSTIDTVVEAVGAGAADIVEFTGLAGQTFILAANVERLTLLGGAAANGTGNALANTITGNAAVNVLDGGAGNDILQGGGGRDVLIGGIGRDTLVGGTGNDIFRYASKAQSVGANVDRISDFDDLGNDRIDLSKVFAGTLQYIHNAAFSDTGQVRINDIAGPDVIVEVNTGGSLAADMQIRLVNTTLASMTASDFFL